MLPKKLKAYPSRLLKIFTAKVNALEIVIVIDGTSKFC